MSPPEDFVPFPKVPRLNRLMTVTEKLDGANMVVAIGDDGSFRVGKRSAWITPEDDCHGFARWAYANREELLQLGPGRHFGEWWGAGIQRRYGLSEKRFSLFNTKRWSSERPACCHVVPVLYEGPFDTNQIADLVAMLRTTGSVASPGFMRPEGLMVWHAAAGQAFKVTCEKDEKPKGSTEAAE